MSANPDNLRVVREELTKLTVEDSASPTGGPGERVATTKATFTGTEDLDVIKAWTGAGEVTSRVPGARKAALQVEAPLIGPASHTQIAHGLQMSRLYDDQPVIESTAIEVVQMDHADGTTGGYRLKAPQAVLDPWRLYEGLVDGAVELLFLAEGFPDPDNNGWRAIKAFELVGTDVYLDIDERYTSGASGEFGAEMVPNATNGNVRLRIGEATGWNHKANNGQRYNVEGEMAADSSLFQALVRIALFKWAFEISGKSAAKMSFDYKAGDWLDPSLTSARSGVDDDAPIQEAKAPHVTGRRVLWFTLGGGALVFAQQDVGSSISMFKVDLDWSGKEIDDLMAIAGTVPTVGDADGSVEFETYTIAATEIAMASQATRIQVRADGSVGQGEPLDLIIHGLAGDYHVIRIPALVIASRPVSIGPNGKFSGGAVPSRRTEGGSVFYQYFRPLPPLA